MATKTFRIIRNAMVSECGGFLVRFVLLLRSRLYGLYFASRHPNRAEIAWKCFLEAQEACRPQKIWLGVIFREKSELQIRSNFSGGVSGAGGSSRKYVLGPVTLCARPGSTDCPGAVEYSAGGVRVCGVYPTPDSNLTLHYM